MGIYLQKQWVPTCIFGHQKFCTNTLETIKMSSKFQHTNIQTVFLRKPVTLRKSINFFVLLIRVSCFWLETCSVSTGG